MRDVVLEWYIPYFPDRKKQLIKAVMISATFVCFFDAIFFAAAMIYPGIILAVVDFFLFRSWKYEYEYVYVNGEFDISKIIRNAKRKDVYRVDRLDIEEYIPGRAAFSGKTTKDFTSGRPGASVYTIMAKGEAVYIEPSEEFTEEMNRHYYKAVR
jgi:hypothetical protein